MESEPDKPHAEQPHPEQTVTATSKEEHKADSGSHESAGAHHRQHEPHHRHHGVPVQSTPESRARHKEEAKEAEEKLAHDEVHHYDGQLKEVAEHAEHVLHDPNLPADAKLNALDDAEALPHGGYLRGDC
ncbi:hypothetical protein BMF94_6101 [Rhodotorula taiwanensis]|uniref:Uncharacterized protein n=1 Tax=Rhodotorula taiwanensis TaxID=741276 RepID=A0A2S5B2B3_9BASI|nr:hypothetical protein BMF94_6101 [Rhodotorula taiwanensis]